MMIGPRRAEKSLQGPEARLLHQQRPPSMSSEWEVLPHEQGELRPVEEASLDLPGLGEYGEGASVVKDFPWLTPGLGALRSPGAPL